MSDRAAFTALSMPRYAGYYQLASTATTPTMRVYLGVRPRVVHRLFMRWLLGWTWHDEGRTS
jgi:hypothetical protein